MTLRIIQANSPNSTEIYFLVSDMRSILSNLLDADFWRERGEEHDESKIDRLRKELFLKSDYLETLLIGSGLTIKYRIKGRWSAIERAHHKTGVVMIHAMEMCDSESCG